MFCTKCGKPNDDDALFCEFCGAKFEEEEAVVEVKPAPVSAPEPVQAAVPEPEPEPAPAPEPIPEPAPVQAVVPEFTPIPEPAPAPAPTQLFCEKCGKPSEPDALFCGYCGAIFGEAAVDVKTAQAAVPVSEPAHVPAPIPAPSAIPKDPKKRKKVGIIAAIASAAVIVVVIIIVLANRPSAPESNAQMKINGKSIPVEMAAFDIPSSAPTVYLCGKTNNGAYICTVSFKTLPAANSDYSASDASVTIAYSGKDTKASNGAHQYALLSTDTTKISVGEYQWGDSIELTVEGKTNPDVYKDYEGMLVFNISGTASFDNGASGALADWKKDNIIPD